MKLDIDFFKIDPNSVSLKQGIVLVSEPFSNDSYFKRSVVLLTEHNENGTIGFILNKPVEARINEFIEDFPETDSRVFLGGPVSTNTVHFLHTVGDQIPNSVQIFEDIYWGGDFEAIKSLIQLDLIPKEKILFFVGYSGWSPNQLENEIKHNYWTVANLTQAEIMAEEKDEIWRDSLEKLGGKFKIWGNSPENPEFN
jgi:putative transcriptional regulator